MNSLKMLSLQSYFALKETAPIAGLPLRPPEKKPKAKRWLPARHFMRWLLVFSVVLQAVLGVIPAFAQGNSHAVAQALDERNRILLTLVGDVVGLNTVQLALTATPLMDAPALQVAWTVGSAQMLGGALAETLGATAADSSAQQTRAVVLPGEGVYPLLATVTYQPTPAQKFGASTMLFALVDAAGSVTLTASDPNAVSPMHSQMPTQVVELDAQAGIASTEATHDDPCFTVLGKVTRIERVPTQTGLQAAIRVPVRNAVVEMNEEDIFFDDSYGETLTDVNGDYWFSFCDDDGIFDDDLEIYVTLRAELRVNDFSVVEVTDISYIDETYEYESAVIESDGGDFNISFELTPPQSAVFNMADAVLDAYQFWKAMGGTFVYQAEVRWEPGVNEDTSHYNGDTYDEINISDAPADPDEWDDSVIMHEWGHMADDAYSCDDNPGGDHSLGQSLSDPEQAWGEGYPDYYQSAVRAALGVPDSNFYLESNGLGQNILAWNLEGNVLVSPNSEDGVAAMLWDLADDFVDGQDMKGVGHGVLQQVYTHPEFADNGDVFDDECTVFAYLRAWKALAKPTDAATAASITQNIGSTTPFGLDVAASNATDNAAIQVAGEQATNGASSAEDYIWWQQVTMVADNSPSMAQDDKFDAVKTVMAEQVNDLQNSERGVEFGLYTFNNMEAGSQEFITGRFYADAILPHINAMQTTTGGVEPCKVNAFNALAASIQEKRNGQAWLYTDGETNLGPGVEAMQQMLTTHGLHGSFVLLGGCSSPPDAQPLTYGATYNFLGLAANGTQPSGIVPYLLTAIASGGNFLFVDKAQLSDAGDILRAQLSHSAGAGRWSDYVSNTDTYSWDTLTRWEYEWVTPAPADYRGQAVLDQLQIAIPPVTVFGASFDALRVDGDGLVTMGAEPVDPSPIASKRLLKVLNGDLAWEPILTAQTSDADDDMPDAPDAGYLQDVSATDTGEWVVITTEGTRLGGDPRAYQVLLNKNTGEIRYQYKDVPDGDAGIATIALKMTHPLPSGGADIVVSNMDEIGANPGMGYKFTPMPPQPTKTYTVPVDGLMNGVGFLLTGYSGSFAPIVVTDPNGNVVDCNAPGSLCLDLGLVQYVQTNVNGRNGDWHATVAPGNTGDGTFSFSVMAASAIKVESPFSHQIALGQPAQLRIDLGGPVEGNQLTAWLQQPNGSALGGQFTLYDDGAHGDGRAGDGHFGLADFMPPAAGVGYLWVRGVVNGIGFQRSDATPYNFQPVNVEGPATLPYLGSGALGIDYSVTNLGDEMYCFEPSIQMPDGWSGVWDDASLLCLNPDASAMRRLQVTPTSLQDPAPSGSSGEVIVTFREQERGQIVDSAATKLGRYNAPALLTIENHHRTNYLRPNGSDTAAMLVRVADDEGYPVVDGTVVELSATLGTVTPAQGGTINGQLPIIFTAGTTIGEALIEASVAGIGEAAQTTMPIQDALPDTMSFEVDPADLQEGFTANMLVTVRDHWGDPLAGQTIRIGVENDIESGVVAAMGNNGETVTSAIQATEIVTLTTDIEGKVEAVFTKEDSASGNVRVRAELLFDEGDGLHVALEEQRIIVLTSTSPYPLNMYFPSIRDGQ